MTAELETQIKNLQYFLSEFFRYGLVVQGKAYNLPGKYTIDEFYHSIDPLDFHEFKVGICWDYVAYEDFVFRSFYKTVKYKLYYIESEDGRTHTFLVYWKNDKPVLFEALLRGCRGCFEFKNIKELFTFIVNKHFQNHKQKSYFILEYNQPNEYGMTSKEFMDYVTSTGKLRMKNGLLYENVK